MPPSLTHLSPPTPHPIPTPPDVTPKKKKKKKNFQQSTTSSTRIKLSVTKKVRFGESVLAVGSGSALGNWNPAESRAALRWSEGDVWTGELPREEGEGAEFKFVVVRGGEIVEWEEGGNRVLIAAVAGSGVVAARWGETGAHKSPSASASSSSSKSKREAAKAREAAASAPSPLGMRGGGQGGDDASFSRPPSSAAAGGAAGGAATLTAPGGAAWVGAETRFGLFFSYLFFFFTTFFFPTQTQTDLFFFP